jgi:small-conductance mechanosensitive channel
VAHYQYTDPYLEKGLFTGLALTAVYLLFEILLGGFLIKRVKDSKTRYSFRKILSVLSIAIFIVIFVSIWLAETQNILIAIGLIGAAIAFAIQDIFKNFIGGVMIFLNGIYSVGDRIEVGDKHGDVIDIGIFYTTLMETRGWVSGDQVTGRLTVIPNGGVLTGTVHNYTRDFDFIWDEITIPVTYDSDWNEATRLIIDIIKKETETVALNAQKIMEKIEGKYYFTKRSLEPAIFLTLTDNWITFGVRYVAEVRSRRAMHDRLTRLILKEFEKSEKITIASTTINIVGFPPIDMEHKRQD